MVTKQEFATLVVAMQAMYGEDFIGTEQALDVWYALLHDLDYQILSKALQQYMLTNKFKPTVAELREIYAEPGDSLAEVVNRFEDMGATVHVTIEILNKFDDYHKSFNMLGNIPVVTFSNQSYDWKMLMIKRVMDIAGSIVGLVITAVVTVFLAPPLLIESPGPLFFAQKRVGKNGRFFKIYKFRSMYKDAEERKKELESQNEMNGLMFKMKDDPRITKVGKFIRKTSIDELPQFFNVLKGDMSLVGTRPPTVDEFKQYESHQKRRLSAKPGITGLWQVSGRNEITDFEDVVKLDVQYIDNWSLGLDIKIILKTIKVVFEKGGE